MPQTRVARPERTLFQMVRPKSQGVRISVFSYSPFCTYASRDRIAEKQATPSKDICLQCKTAPVKAGWLFCGAACDRDAHTDAPQLIEVPSSYEAYASGKLFAVFLWNALTSHVATVKRQFEEKWQHNTKTPEVRHIYKICCDQRILDRYTKYRYVHSSSRA